MNNNSGFDQKAQKDLSQILLQCIKGWTVIYNKDITQEERKLIHEKYIKNTADFLQKLRLFSKGIAVNFNIVVLQQDGTFGTCPINMNPVHSNNTVTLLVADGKLFYLIDTSMNIKKDIKRGVDRDTEDKGL